MSIERVRDHLRAWNREGEIQEFTVSSATVTLAAKALEVEEGRIAKSLSFAGGDSVILLVVAGDVLIDNRKYKELFGHKARMLTPAEVSERVGHEVGGVCPFGLKDGVEVYLDVSLRRFATIFPACGSSSSAIQLRCDELEEIAGATGWVDVCKHKG